MDSSWKFVFFSYTCVQFIFFAYLCSVKSILTKMKRLCFIALFATLVMGCSNTPKAYPDLKFMSFNIRLGSQWAANEDGPNAWSQRKEAVVAMILTEAPDAIGMQEVLPHQFIYLDSALAGMYKSIGVGRDNGLPATDTACDGEIMCIFYRTDRLELLDQHTYWLSPTPDSVSFGWDAACRRTVTIGQFRDMKTDSTFVYMNTHLDHVGKEARKNSILMLFKLSQDYSCPVILGGDMNSTLEDSIFLPLAEDKLISARDLVDTTDNATTYNAFGKAEGKQIDHFFVRGWSKVKAFHTLNSDYGVPYISDHYPVSTTLEY